MKKCILFLLCLCLIIPTFPLQKVKAEEEQGITEDSIEDNAESESSIDESLDTSSGDSSAEESISGGEEKDDTSLPEDSSDSEASEESSEESQEESSSEESSEESSSEESSESLEDESETEDSEEEKEEEEEELEPGVYQPSEWLLSLLNARMMLKMAVQGHTYEGEIGNFPSDYRALLENLHAAHPNWVFVAEYTGIDFATAVKMEASGDRSQVPNLSSDLIKSNTSSDYYPSSGTYRIVDGSGSNGWVNANQAIISYFMDPRNFLNDKYIWQFESYSYDAGTQKQSTVEQIWSGPTINGTKQTTFKIKNGSEIQEVSYAYVIAQAGKTTGVSPVWLASKIRQEVGSGTGSITGTYSTDTGVLYNGTIDLDGYFNYYNIGAYAGSTPIANGLYWAAGNPKVVDGENVPTVTSYERPWDSPDKAILGGAEYIAANYLSSGQKTGYLSRFNVTSNNTYNHQYMGNLSGAATEAYSTYSAYSSMGIINASRLFYIPVFNNMPSTSVKPKISGSTAKATVTSSTLTLRDAPSVGGSSIVSLPQGTTVTILEGALDNTQRVGMYNVELNPYWFKVSATVSNKSYTGYVSADFLKMTTAKTLSAGGTTQLSLSSSVGQTVYYQSGNPWIATVDSNGKVTALREGSVDIYCYTAAGIDSIGINVKSSNSSTTALTSSSISVSSIANQAFTGSAIKPSITVKKGSTILSNGTDYTVSYSNNVLPGTATVTVSGKGAYSDTCTKSFTITGNYSTYVTTANLNYRKGPGFSYETVGTKSKGSKVEVLSGYSFSSDNNIWVIVKIGSNHYYMSNSYLEKEVVNNGWAIKGTSWYYYQNGKYLTGWNYLNIGWYCFDNNGVLITGWKKTDGYWYYLNPSGIMAHDQWIGGKYYVKSDGKMAVSEWVDNGKYYVDSNGVYMQTGWIKNSIGYWYRFSNGSYPKNQWYKINEKWYYFDSQGYMKTGWLQLNGIWYYLKSSGAMAANEWQKINGYWYHFNSSGAMQTGWIKLGSDWYYLKSNGVMAANEVIDGKYRISSSGVWISDSSGTETLVTYKTTANLNYRSGPGTSYAIKGTLAKGTSVKVVSGYSKSANGYTWYKIKIGSSYYYAASNYLTK